MIDARVRKLPLRMNFRAENGVAVFFLASCFFIGSVAGCMVGGFSPSGDLGSTLSGYVDTDRDIIGFFVTLWACSKYHLLILFLASSVAGVFFLPLLCVIRGYLLGCTAASLTAFDGGWLLSLLVVGLPAVFTLPGFFLLCEDGMFTSRRLLVLSAGGAEPRRSVPLYRHCLVAAVLLIIAALLQHFLIPGILTRLL
jgi:UPF0716 family protein affecting phage T7 exclusion